jgi:hypothetical protein
LVSGRREREEREKERASERVGEMTKEMGPQVDLVFTFTHARERTVVIGSLHLTQESDLDLVLFRGWVARLEILSRDGVPQLHSMLRPPLLIAQCPLFLGQSAVQVC